MGVDLRRHAILASLWLALMLGMLGMLGPLLWLGAAQAAESEVFVVRNVAVDRTADTAAAAREAAIADGHSMALQRLIERIVPAARQADVPKLTADQIASYVADFSVFSERTSEVRYLANMTFRFKDDAVRQLMRGNRIPYAETRGEPVVVLPIYGESAEAKLWDEPNPWYRAWEGRRFSDGLVPVMLPLGDLQDMVAIDARAALLLDRTKMAALRERYGVDSIIVAQAVLGEDSELASLQLRVVRSRESSAFPQTAVEDFTAESDESLSELLARAAQAAYGQIQEDWKQANLLLRDSSQSITAAIETPTLEDWLDIKSRLEGVAGIDQARVAALSKGRTVVDLTYLGGETQLLTALRQRDLEIGRDRLGRWYLWLKGNPPVEFAEGGVQPAEPATTPFGGADTGPASRDDFQIFTTDDPAEEQPPSP